MTARSLPAAELPSWYLRCFCLQQSLVASVTVGSALVTLDLGVGRTDMRGGTVLGLLPPSLEFALLCGHGLVALLLLSSVESSEYLDCLVEL